MIDVSIYMQQLEELRSKLLWQINGFYLNVNQIPKLGFEKILELWFEHGVMFYDSNDTDGEYLMVFPDGTIIE